MWNILTLTQYTDRMGTFAHILDVNMIHIYYRLSCDLLEKLPVVQLLRSSQHFMKPQGSLPCSQEPYVYLFHSVVHVGSM
jgi:hypothetical protein